uniref:Uncharacterized protein n=1 Tax=Rhizophora mucronata TaxID=61149 RepID=A0A2P2JDH4_RHIMU
MKRTVPWSEPVDLISSDDSSSDTDMEVNNGGHGHRSSLTVSINPPAKEMIPEGN